MRLFKKKVELIKQVSLTSQGWEVWYKVRVNGYTVKGTSNQIEAYQIFDAVIKEKGITEVNHVLRKEYV